MIYLLYFQIDKCMTMTSYNLDERTKALLRKRQRELNNLEQNVFKPISTLLDAIEKGEAEVTKKELEAVSNFFFFFFCSPFQHRIQC